MSVVDTQSALWTGRREKKRERERAAGMVVNAALHSLRLRNF